MTSGRRNVSRCGLISRLSDERGAFMVIFALVLLVIIGFAALGVEAGRWYLVRAELAKGVDAASLSAAKNIGNPFVDPEALAREFGDANFYAGYMGTPGSTQVGTVHFEADIVGTDRVRVAGNVHAHAILARVFGIDTIPIRAESMAQRRDVEIMMILDRSGSMNGQKFEDLKAAANSFLDLFEYTQARDRVGLISYAYHATVDRALGTNFVGAMRTALYGMTAIGATNMEDAFDQADGPKGFPDLTGVPGEQRVQQFVLFFSDGMPTAMRGKFWNDGKDYDAVAVHGGNCMPDEGQKLGNNLYDALTGKVLKVGPNELPSNPTGDGKPSATSACGSATTKWSIFERIPVPGYSPEYCKIPVAKLSGSDGYFCKTARQLTLEHTQELKDKGIRIFVVGLGSDGTGGQKKTLDADFLKALSSGEDYTYITPDSKELQDIFNKIAREIKLRLVQ